MNEHNKIGLVLKLLEHAPYEALKDNTTLGSYLTNAMIEMSVDIDLIDEWLENYLDLCESKIRGFEDGERDGPPINPFLIRMGGEDEDGDEETPPPDTSKTKVKISRKRPVASIPPEMSPHDGEGNFSPGSGGQIIDPEDYDYDDPQLLSDKDEELTDEELEELEELYEAVAAGNDIPLLKLLGGENLSDDDLQVIIDDTKNSIGKGVSFPRGGKGTTYSTDSTYNVSMLQTILKSEGKLLITHASQVKKLRTLNGLRICTWEVSKRAGDTAYKRLAAIYHFYKKNASSIELKAKSPAGIQYEQMQIDHVNKFFSDTFGKNPAPMPLFINGQSVGVEINGAVDIAGVPKADFAFTKNGKEVYWISYKQGDYTAGTANDVSFQQYGSMTSFFSKKFTGTPAVKKDIATISDPFIKEVMAKLPKSNVYKNVKEIVEDPPKSDKFYMVYSSGKKEEVTDSAQIKVLGVARNANVMKGQPWSPPKNIYITPPKAQYYREIDPKSDLAMRAIYGTDFGGAFGTNNVNALLLTSKKIDIAPIIDPAGTVTGINIVVAGKSHIEFNPQPAYKGVAKYIPSLLFRYSSTFNWSTPAGVILGGRYLIMPLGRASGTKI